MVRNALTFICYDSLLKKEREEGKGVGKREEEEEEEEREREREGGEDGLGRLCWGK